MHAYYDGCSHASGHETDLDLNLGFRKDLAARIISIPAHNTHESPPPTPHLTVKKMMTDENQSQSQVPGVR